MNDVDPTGPLANEAARTEVRQKRNKNADLARAIRALFPYRKIVVISIVSAFFVGLIGAGGVGALLPILQVLIKGDSVQGWVDRQIVEHRLGVQLSEDPGVMRFVKVDSDGLAQKSGFKAGDAIEVAPDPQGKFGPMGLADPATKTTGLVMKDRPGQGWAIGLPKVPFYYVWARHIASKLPVDPVYTIATLFGVLAVLTVLGSVARFFQEYLSDTAAISAVNDIRKRLYDHVLHIPMEFFGLRGTSDVTSRLVQDCQGLQDGFKSLLGQSIQEPIRAAFYFTLALIIDWRITLFIVLFAPLMGATIKKFGKKMRRASRAALQRSSAMLGQIEGTLVGIRVVKGASAERFERRRYATIMSELRREQLNMARYEAWATPAMETVALFVVGVVLMVASWLMFRQRTLSASSFFTIMACLVGIGESLRRVSKLNTVLQKSNAAAGRVFELMDVPIERRHKGRVISGKGKVEERKDNPIKLAPLQDEIRFENITFSYAGANHTALDDVSLSVKRGESVAVVGRNGSGKTTLLAMLPRFYDPQRGRVTVDGVDVRDASLRSLRGQIAIVTQESVVFPGTIAQNIAYGHPLAGNLHLDTAAVRRLREQIEHAAKRAFAHEFIIAKAQGYDTSLDGLGSQLSGGQRQRLNIARAILRRSPILILDEATSQVDAESEHLIQQAIESIMHECTTFVIAHRFSTILSADRIIVMDRGRVVGEGKHEQLLQTCPTYQQLYERQLVAAPVG